MGGKAGMAIAVFGLAVLTARAVDAPYVLTLGSAQDGGAPQIGCARECCAAARANPERRRLVASLLIVDPRSGKRWLVDATPDLPDQVELFRGHPRSRKEAGARPPLVDGVFLTHAHMGHYAGLVHLGREAYNHPRVPVFCSARMKRFLEGNGPWDLLIRNGNLEPRVLAPDAPFQLAPDLSVTPFLVPHRDEYTDTFGFLIQGPNRALLYIPDIDKWARWDRRVETWLARSDRALLDGTFFADGEVPGRAMAEIPHPFILESLARFQDLPEAERRKIVFTHLNHSNPAADPASRATARIREAGMAVAARGDRFGL